MGWGSRPALLLVDLYRGDFGERPQPLLEALDRWPQSCGLAAWDAIPTIRSVLEAARRASVPVVHITGIVGSRVKPWAQIPGGRPFAPEGFDPYEIMPDFAPAPDEAIIRKSAPSAFSGTVLLAHLRELDVDTLVICGESTSGCVRATVVDGRTYRFRVLVVESGVFDRHKATHAINLFDMHQKYADVVCAEDVITELECRGRRA